MESALLEYPMPGSPTAALASVAAGNASGEQLVSKAAVTQGEGSFSALMVFGGHISLKSHQTCVSYDSTETENSHDRDLMWSLWAFSASLVDCHVRNLGLSSEPSSDAYPMNDIPGGKKSL